MISIRKHIERLGGEEKLRKAFREILDSIAESIRDHVLVTDAEEHAWFCSSLDNLRTKLQEDSSFTNIEVVSALLVKTVADHWTRLGKQVQNREQELKRIINLLTESASRLDAENKQFYLELRSAVTNFQSISQLEDITFLRKKLSEQVTHLQEAVGRQEAASQGTIGKLQVELEAARRQIAELTEAAFHDALTRLPSRNAAETKVREMVDRDEPFTVAMAVIDRLDTINLRYGAEAGDDVIRRFAQRLRESFPERILLCRWGGPSFVAVLEHQAAAEVRPMLHKVLADIAAEPIEISGKGVGFLRMTSRYAVHQAAIGEHPEKIIRLIDIFCLARKGEPAESSEHGISAGATTGDGA